MKTFLKLGFSVLLMTAFAIGLTTVTAQPADAITYCPSFECPSKQGYVYVGPCYHDPGGCQLDCSLYRIEGGSILCYTDCDFL